LAMVTFYSIYCTITATYVYSTLSLHDALPIYTQHTRAKTHRHPECVPVYLRKEWWCSRRSAAHKQCRSGQPPSPHPRRPRTRHRDRKSTRLNSSHVKSSYAVFCWKKKIREHKR